MPAVLTGPQPEGLLQWRATYAPEHGSAAQARLEVVAALSRARVRGAALEHAEMVTAELVNNAIIHAGTRFTVEVHVDGGRVRIEVRDGSVRTPLMVERRADEWPGMGLHIVAALATAWGWQLSLAARGKAVWAELDARA